MKITVCYTGQLAAATGVSEEELDVVDGVTLGALLRQVATAHGDDVARHLFREGDEIQTGVLIVVDDRQVDRSAPLELSEGARVLLLTPIAGG